MTAPRELDFKFDHAIDKSYTRELSYLFDLEDGTYVRLWISGHLYVAREGREGQIIGEPRMFVVNRDTCDHPEARVRSFLDSADVPRIAWGLFWELAVEASFDGLGDSMGKFDTWLRVNFGDHIDEWFARVQNSRAAEVRSVLET